MRLLSTFSRRYGTRVVDDIRLHSRKANVTGDNHYVSSNIVRQAILSDSNRETRGQVVRFARIQVSLGDQPIPTVTHRQHAILPNEIQASIVNRSEREQVFFQPGNVQDLIQELTGGWFLNNDRPKLRYS